MLSVWHTGQTAEIKPAKRPLVPLEPLALKGTADVLYLSKATNPPIKTEVRNM